MPTTNNSLLTEYTNNFNFDSETLNLYIPHIKHILSFFAKSKVKKITIYDCFHFSMTFFQINNPFETCKLIAFYTYYITQNLPDLIKEY